MAKGDAAKGKDAAEDKVVASEDTQQQVGSDVGIREAGGALMTMDFEGTIGEGFEDATASAFAIPFFKVLQSMSKQCKRANPEYVEGAIEGNFFNTVSNEVFDGAKGVLFVPVHFIQKFLEWAGTLDEGGGLVAQHNVLNGEALLAKTTRDADGNDRLPDNHILQDVREHYGIAIHPETGMFMPVVLSMASSQIKKSKRFMSNMGAMKRNPQQPHPDASYTHIYRLTTVPEKKDQFDFYGLQITHVCGLEKATEMGILDNPQDLFNAAQEFRSMVRSGKAVAAVDAEEIPF